MKKLLVLPCLFLLTACPEDSNADKKAKIAQEKSLAEAFSQVGMPAITNFQEKRMLKQVYELRDQTLATHTYIVNHMQGCLVYLGQSIGYGIPYAAQYSAPDTVNTQYSSGNSPQAEPNGLFMPSSAQGTWVNMLNPDTKKAEVVYIEPETLVSPFRLTKQECK
jgi:hypothetical protein